MKNKMILIFVLSVVILLVGLFLFRKKEESKEIYTLITDDRFLTLQNDGGTHFDTRYEIDMKAKTIVKLEDYYKGFEGVQYKDKVLYKRSLNETEKLQELFDEIIKNKEQYEQDKEHTYVYYELKVENQEIKIYDTTMIQKLEAILKEI